MMAGRASWTGRNAGWTVEDGVEALKVATASLAAAATDKDREAATAAVEFATAVLDELRTGRERSSAGGESASAFCLVGFLRCSCGR